LVVCKTNAQVVIPTAGSYQTNTTMGAFHGTWQWVNGTDTVKIYLYTKKVFSPLHGGYFDDCLIGWHIYKKGNTVIESSYSGINNVDSRTFLGSNLNEPSGVVEGIFKDLTKHKEGELTLTLNTAGNQLTWKLVNVSGLSIRKPTDPPYEPNFTLPKNMVLTKQ